MMRDEVELLWTAPRICLACGGRWCPPEDVDCGCAEDYDCDGWGPVVVDLVGYSPTQATEAVAARLGIAFLGESGLAGHLTPLQRELWEARTEWRLTTWKR